MKFIGFFLTFLFVFGVQAQKITRDFDLKTNGTIEIKNLYGKVLVSAEESAGDKVYLAADAQKSIEESEIKTVSEGGRISVSVNPKNQNARIDLTLKIPLRSRVRVETDAGEVRISGSVASANVTTETGTISTDVPLDSVKFDFLWTSSRPRYLSNTALPKEVKEKSGGKYELSGKLGAAEKKKDKEKGEEQATIGDSETGKDEENAGADDKKSKDKGRRAKDDKTVELNFTTARGIVLLNVNPNEVPSNLQERPLTEAAKSIVRSGDSLLTEAIRRTSPKYFGDYLKTLPPRKIEPSLAVKSKIENGTAAKIKQVLVKVVDENNRAIGGLQKGDFTVLESGSEREILSVQDATAPFNLVLLLDVSGSVENYVDFIRKAARNFIGTMRPSDRITILIFNEDVKQITTFTANREKLSESLDTFEAGGGTAYYDAIAYSLVETLRPLKSERTAIVALTDGDDNRSFLPFESLLGSIQESGALIYPLYVPSGLIAASKNNDPNDSADPLRTRFYSLTTKAETEGARLAQVSGGVYYPIKRLGDLQKAYEDIAVQLRTAYLVTFRSELPDAAENRPSPRLKIKTNRPNTFVNLGTIREVSTAPTSENFDNRQPENIKAKFISAKFTTESFLQQPPEITGEVSKVIYKPLLTNSLKNVAEENFDINKSPPAFLLNNLAVSRWVSPKRTRSYPYERIYNTLLQTKRATVIPIMKDEGEDGERDFLQFDTISLLNLLDVYLIVGYYSDAQRDSKNELTDQQFDNAFVVEKLKQLESFKGTATEWNLQQLQEISAVAEKAKNAYAEISARTGVTLHDAQGIENFQKRIGKSYDDFRAFSRQKSQTAQSREFQTVQPKEALSTDTKGRVTISDISGGKYYFTCDETKIENKVLYLIEDKHTVRAKLPAASDIKDGLLKMMLYANLQNVRVGRASVSSKPVLRLTSGKIEGAISSNADGSEVDNFLQSNNYTISQGGFIKKLFEEARTNKFEIRIEKGEIK